MSDVFCITGGSEGQNPLTLVIKQRQRKQVNSGLHVNAASLPLERGAALPFHFPVSTRALQSSVVSTDSMPCALGLLIKTYSLLFSIH